MKRILIIDDTQHVRKFIREALDDGNYEILEAQDGEEGLAAFVREAPDLVITDIVMTRVDGLTVIREVRKLAPQVPILAISGGSPSFNSEHLLKIARMERADAVLFKPFDLALFISTVEQLLAI